MSRPRGETGLRRLGDERGAVAVLFALTVVVLFGAVAFVIDISRLYHARQVLQNAVDLGALAGAQELPVQGITTGAIAEDIAKRVAIANAPQLAGGGLTITFKCIVGDRDDNNSPDPGEVPFVCGPSAGTWPAATWTYKKSRAAHVCDPYEGDKCNTIRLSTSENVNYFFAPVIGINSGNTGAVNAASCKGACGAASSPIDAVMVLDRTGSMTASDIANVKNAALSVLSFYDSSLQWVGLVALPYKDPLNPCEVFGDRRPSPPNPGPRTYQVYPDSNYTDWQVEPLSQDYTAAGGGLNTLSRIVQSINCMQRARDYQTTSGDRVYAISDGGTPSGSHTNLGDPLDAARDMLLLQGRVDVPDVIIFMTDGQANQPSTRLPCKYFNDKATIAKSEDPPQTIFTIAYGLDSPPVQCADSSGLYRGKFATTNMADAATDSNDDFPGGCGANENKDNDHYFCTPGSADLEPVFRQVASEAIESAHLVDDF
jgi:type II secretory pathway pseudopilin PulG